MPGLAVLERGSETLFFLFKIINYPIQGQREKLFFKTSFSKQAECSNDE